MDLDRSKFLNKIYELIESQDKIYGDYKKCELHIHTPESKCYRFITPDDKLDSDEDLENITRYSEMSLEEVLEYSKSIKFLSDDVIKTILNDVDEYEKGIIKQSKDKGIKYNSLKEYITYEIIAHKLYIENINIAVISDHNTIAGYDKLLYAINQYNKTRSINKGYKFKLFLGVEISCSDKNHLMVIVNEKNKEKLKKYLDGIIMGENLGSYLDTRTIIEGLQKLNPIIYIAHANSSKFYGNEVYNKLLFNLEGLNGFGMKNIEDKNKIINRIRFFNKNINDKAFVIEADSHAINEIGRKNCWIKINTMNFNSLKKAFLNHKICISNEKPNKTNIEILGLVIEKGENGFLGPYPNQEKNKYMVINFSSDLNCIIGGRGTGKSTILNIIETIYSQEIDNLELLNFISQHKRIYSLFKLENNEYMLEFLPQISYRGNYDLIPRVSKHSYIKDGKIYKLNSDWYKLFKISKDKKVYTEIKSNDVYKILNLVFKRGYNINKLVGKINNNEISDYVKEVMFNNISYENINYYITEIEKVNDRSLLAKVRNSIDNIIEIINDRKTEFNLKLNEFNNKNKDKIKIEYKSINNQGKLLEDFFNIICEGTYEMNRSICNTYLKWSDLEKYLFDCTKKLGYLETLKMILDKKFNLMDKKIPLRNYEGIEENYKTIDIELEHIDKDKIKEINNEIINRINRRKYDFRKNIINCFSIIDNFEIYFNVNFKEDENNLPKNFKNIENLSLGQKVAALLTFVLEFGIVTNDSTPLIIDQPEDNLDNVYIYKTLVESLKSIKNKRQVIVVTHSSTIVTNADSEKVIVLKSDSDNGWISKQGYPSDKQITRQILNYLEGGNDSFNHKYNMYKTILVK